MSRYYLTLNNISLGELKGQCHDIFDTHQSWPLIHILKFFDFAESKKLSEIFNGFSSVNKNRIFTISYFRPFFSWFNCIWFHHPWFIAKIFICWMFRGASSLLQFGDFCRHAASELSVTQRIFHDTAKSEQFFVMLQWSLNINVSVETLRYTTVELKYRILKS